MAAVILHWKNQESWDLSQGRDVNGRGNLEVPGEGLLVPTTVARQTSPPGL